MLPCELLDELASSPLEELLVLLATLLTAEELLSLELELNELLLAEELLSQSGQ